MPAVHEIAYPRLKSTITPDELQEIYTPTPEEMRFYDKVVKGRQTKGVFMILLKVFQRLGRFPLLTEVPAAIVSHIAQQMGVTLEEHLRSMVFWIRARNRKASEGRIAISPAFIQSRGRGATALWNPGPAL